MGRGLHSLKCGIRVYLDSAIRYDQPTRVYLRDAFTFSPERAGQYSAQLTRVAVGMLVDLIQALVEAQVLTEEQIEKIL